MNKILVFVVIVTGVILGRLYLMMLLLNSIITEFQSTAHIQDKIVYYGPISFIFLAKIILVFYSFLIRLEWPFDFNLINHIINETKD